jgi:hypothetical protein
MPSLPLTYAPALPKPQPLFHLILLPLIWLPAAIGARLFANELIQIMIFFPTVPLMILFQNRLETTTILNIALAFTLLAVIGLGHLLDSIRAPRWIYFALPPIFLLALASRFFPQNFQTGLQSIPPPPPAAAWHRSNLFPAWCFTLYLFAVAVILLTALLRPFFRRRSMF